MMWTVIREVCQVPCCVHLHSAPSHRFCGHAHTCVPPVCMCARACWSGAGSSNNTTTTTAKLPASRNVRSAGCRAADPPHPHPASSPLRRQRNGRIRAASCISHAPLSWRSDTRWGAWEEERWVVQLGGGPRWARLLSFTSPGITSLLRHCTGIRPARRHGGGKGFKGGGPCGPEPGVRVGLVVRFAQPACRGRKAVASGQLALRAFQDCSMSHQLELVSAV
jgi:hypothetical protein